MINKSQTDEGSQMSNIYEHAARYIRSVESPVLQAGMFAKDSFKEVVKVTAKAYGDVVTDVDHACEKIIVDAIQSKYPKHRVISEEVGEVGEESEWTWIVDPLDGTHNYIAGLPLFGMIVSLFHKDEPVAALLHDAWQTDTIIGAVKSGVHLNGTPLTRLNPDLALNRATIGWTQGYAVQKDPIARAVRDCVEGQCKRLIATWSPVIDTIRLLNGQFGAIVSFDGELTDLSAARALVPELGGTVQRFSRGGADRRFVVGPTHVVKDLCAALDNIELLPGNRTVT